MSKNRQEVQVEASQGRGQASSGTSNDRSGQTHGTSSEAI